MAKTKIRTKMSPKKKMAMVITLVLVAALLLGGAFAWIDFSQNFVNRFRGGVTPDVLLHDDFEPWVNKDVYVENPGEQDMYVRIQFKEFLQIGNQILVGSDPEDKEKWEIHEFDGAIDGCDLVSHTYFEWEMTGNEKIYLHGTSEQGNEDYQSMINKIIADLGLDIPGADGTSGIDNNLVIGPNGQMFGKTEAASTIVLLSQWDPMTDGACWILDDSVDGNGWCYWSVPLKKGEATNLLLDNVVKTDTLADDNFAYFIDVQLQASNKTELGKFIAESDMSTLAKTIWDMPEITTIEVSTVEEPFTAETTATMALPGGGGEIETLSLYAQVTGNTALPNVLQKVYWVIDSAPTGVSIDQTGKVTVTDAATAGSFTVKAYSYYNTEFTPAEITITLS